MLSIKRDKARWREPADEVHALELMTKVGRSPPN